MGGPEHGQRAGYQRGGEVNKQKHEQREVCRQLADLIGWQLCGFCKYHDGGSPCDPTDECHHPLNDFVSFPTFSDGYLEPGADCWGFQPYLAIEDVADIVGIGLQNNGVAMYRREGESIKVFCGEPTW